MIFSAGIMVGTVEEEVILLPSPAVVTLATDEVVDDVVAVVKVAYRFGIWRVAVVSTSSS